MILHIQKEIPLYQKLGVFTEAPKKPARRIRTVNAAAPRSLSDYTSDVESEEELNMDDMEVDGLEDGDTDDLTTGADDEELETDDPAATMKEPDAPETGGDDLTTGADDADGTTAADTGTSQTDDAGGTPDEPATDDGGDGGDEPATGGGGDDLTSGADDDGGGGTDDAETGDDGETGGKEFKRDDMRKFILFKKFTDLHTSLENYISKLNTADINNNILARVYREVRGKLQEIESMLYDYMVLKFSADSYASAFYFYEQTKALILILFSLLEEAKEKAKQDQEKSTSRTKT